MSAEWWAASGAMWLTGDEKGPPLAPPGTVAEAIESMAADFDRLTGVAVDGPALLGERAALSRRLHRRGQTSCGDVTRLLRAADGWFALSLARDDDIASVPALLERDVDGDPWVALAKSAADRPAAELVERAALLGMAAAVPGEHAAQPAAAVGQAGTDRALAGLHVLDLTQLWAGPLCTQLLAEAGAWVTKVESATRPDRSRQGAPRLFSLLNRSKTQRRLDLRGEEFRELLDAADIVVFAARQRAIAQLGIDVDAVLASRSDKVVVAITGHGWDEHRIAFGDDAAVAGGLVAWHPTDGEPRFLADAMADPVTGLHAAVAAADAATKGGRWFVEVSLAGTAAHVAREAGGIDAPAVAATWRRRGWVLETDDVSCPVEKPRHR